MYNLIKAEAYKLRYSKTYKGLFIFTLMCVILVVVMSKNTSSDLQLIYTYTDSRAYGFEANRFIDKQNVKGLELFSSSLVYIPVMVVGLIYLVSSVTCDEYSDGTYRNTLTYGHNRINVYIAKLITVTIAITINILILNYGSLLIGIIMYGVGIEFKYIYIVKMFELSYTMMFIFISIASIFMLLGTIIKNKALLVTIGIVALISPVYMIERGIPISLLNKYPIFMLYDICIQTPNTQYILQSIITCIFITIVITIVGTCVFKNQDIQ